MKKRDLPEVRNPYNYDADALSDATGLKCMDPSLTKQEFVEEADINYIAEKFMRTGELQTVIDMPTAGDFQGVFDFQSAMNLVADAKQQFMALPAKLRTRFSNDPQQLLEFLADPENRAEAEKLNLIEKRKPADEPRPDESATSTTQTHKGNPRTAKDASGPAPTEKPGPKTPQDDR